MSEVDITLFVWIIFFSGCPHEFYHVKYQAKKVEKQIVFGAEEALSMVKILRRYQQRSVI